LYVIGEKYQGRDARRPPELLTRDHVARCIVREIREGRGSPHGGVYLELQTFCDWLARRRPGLDKAEYIKKKLPSMYHQFKQLGGIDITQQPMEVGPTVHYIMGGVRVDGDTQMSTVPGLFAAGEVAGGLHGANRLGGNSLSDLLVFGKRAGEYAARFAKDHPAGELPRDQIEAAARWALSFIDQPQGDENPFQVQHDLQQTMQNLVGIVRREEEMLRALEEIARLRERHRRVRVVGNREYNPGWHTAMDLHNLLIVAEAITRCAIERKESRGAQFRDDYPTKRDEFAKVNFVVRKGPDGTMQVRREPIPEMPDYLKRIIEENR
jgi:succinate dehydrogenase / fumarate reductase flavoprotein subunit